MQRAGLDTEQVADEIWTAPSGLAAWRPDDIVRWCDDPRRWSDIEQVAGQPAERMVIIFDNQISCALLPDSAPAIMTKLRDLATRWRVQVVPGPSAYAWPAPRRA